MDLHKRHTQKIKKSVLIIFGYPVGLGGHFRSCLNIIKNQTSEFNFFVVASSGNPDTINAFKEIGATVILLKELDRYARFPNFFGLTKLLKICNRYKIDILHAQDFKSLERALPLSFVANLPLYYTRAGGPYKDQPQPRNTTMIYYSKELVDAVTQKHKVNSERLHLIKERIDYDLCNQQKATEDIVNTLGGPDRFRVLLVSRFFEEKKPLFDSIFDSLKVEANGSKQDKIQFSFIGSGVLEEYIKHEAKTINELHKSQVIKILGPIFDPQELFKWYDASSIVIGTGRGVLEAMAIRKPVILLGPNQQAELFRTEFSEKIEYYNFSGRHFNTRPSNGESIPEIVNKLKNDPELYRTCSEESEKYILDNYDAKSGALKVNCLYNSISGKPGLINVLHWYYRVYNSRIKIYFQKSNKIFKFFKRKR